MAIRHPDLYAGSEGVPQIETQAQGHRLSGTDPVVQLQSADQPYLRVVCALICNRFDIKDHCVYYFNPKAWMKSEVLVLLKCVEVNPMCQV